MFKVYYILTYPLTLICLGLIGLYKLTFSKMNKACNSIPTCSSYGFESVKQFGAIWGGILAIKRIIRCRKICGEYDLTKLNLLGNYKWKC